MNGLVYMLFCALEGCFQGGFLEPWGKDAIKRIWEVAQGLCPSAAPGKAQPAMADLDMAKEDNGEGSIPQSMGPRSQKTMFGEPLPGGRPGAHSWNILPALCLLLFAFGTGLLVLWSSATSLLPAGSVHF